MIETKRVVSILTDLEGIDEDLLNLYEDIQGSIDSRDATSRIQGPRDLAEYAEKLEEFEKVSADLRALIERITKVDMRNYTVSQPTDQSSRLAGLTPHTPDENFTFTHVAGFTLFGSSFIVSKWNRLYATLLQQLAERYPEQFRQLPNTHPFNTSAFNSSFSRKPIYRYSIEPLPGVYCKGTMAVKDLFVNIRRLLAHFGIPESGLVVYLREEGE